MKTTTVSFWLKQADQKLKEAGIPTAQLDSLVLFEDILGKDRAYLLAHPEIEISNQQLAKLNRLITKRAKHQPLAYIRGKTEFYGREFIINKHVLEPRPESETMIELLKSLELPSRPTILDLGTGSGALAITAKLELPHAQIIASDIDPKCLEVGRQNARKHQVEIEFIRGDLLKPLKKPPVAILANLPYVPDDFRLNEAAMNEPKTAIFGGSDGLNIYRKLFEELSSSELRPAFILTESLPFQHKKLAQIAKKNGYRLTKTDDFICLFNLIR